MLPSYAFWAQQRAAAGKSGHAYSGHGHSSSSSSSSSSSNDESSSSASGSGGGSSSSNSSISPAGGRSDSSGSSSGSSGSSGQPRDPASHSHVDEALGVLNVPDELKGEPWPVARLRHVRLLAAATYLHVPWRHGPVAVNACMIPAFHCCNAHLSLCRGRGVRSCSTSGAKGGCSTADQKVGGWVLYVLELAHVIQCVLLNVLVASKQTRHQTYEAPEQSDASPHKSYRDKCSTLTEIVALVCAHALCLHAQLWILKCSFCDALMSHAYHV